MTVLEPMTESEFAAYLEDAVPAYADDKVRSGQCTASESLALAREGFTELLPQGLATPDNHVYTLRDPARGVSVGLLWYAAQDRADQRIAYVYDILVHPAYQRQGHATRAFEWLEQQARDSGLHGIALHVFGHNTGAHRLYARLGFAATNINMFKPVRPVA